MKNFNLTKNALAVGNVQSTDETRYNINGIYFNEKNYIAATDGHCLAIRRYEVNELARALVKISKTRLPKKIDTVEFQRLEETMIDVKTGITAHTEAEVNYPDIEQVIPQFNKNKKTIKLAINPYKLAAVVEALGYDGKKTKESNSDAAAILELELEADGSYSGLGPIAVALRGEPDAAGVIMPVRTDGAPDPIRSLNAIIQRKPTAEK